MIGLSEAIVVDLDGTLVDVSDLRDWVTGKRKDYHQFHTLAEFAPPIPETVKAVQAAWDRGLTVLLVTARQDKYRGGTLRWLNKHNVPFDRLFMRKEKDFRPDYDIKEEILLQDLKDYNIVEAWDDNPHVIKLWDTHGISVHVVPGWVD